jgi:hypothetical protein
VEVFPQWDLPETNHESGDIIFARSRRAWSPTTFSSPDFRRAVAVEEQVLGLATNMRVAAVIRWEESEDSCCGASGGGPRIWSLKVKSRLRTTEAIPVARLVSGEDS